MIPPAGEFEAKDDAIANARELSKENTSSELSIFDNEHNVIKKDDFKINLTSVGCYNTKAD
ncbi:MULTISPECIES: DUF2188 domain-containing protein [Virgibacillus]|uniref:DUF2188 domain-containing protein n=1 Tax=Virgibacillus TaxID=84406 RepID=UPI001FDFDBF6|nr:MULTISPECIES: DUF2188 domain-containing protein [Virgibacillus]